MLRTVKAESRRVGVHKGLVLIWCLLACCSILHRRAAWCLQHKEQDFYYYSCFILASCAFHQADERRK